MGMQIWWKPAIVQEANKFWKSMATKNLSGWQGINKTGLTNLQVGLKLSPTNHPWFSSAVWPDLYNWNCLCNHHYSFLAVLIGNKADLEDQKQVDENEARTLAENLGLKYFETSALSGHNVSESVEALLDQVRCLLSKTLGRDTSPAWNVRWLTANWKVTVLIPSISKIFFEFLQDNSEKKKLQL